MIPLRTSNDNSVNDILQPPQRQLYLTKVKSILLRRGSRINPNIITHVSRFVSLVLVVCCYSCCCCCITNRFVWTVNAYPTGAGSCVGGIPAVDGPHISNSSSSNSSSSSGSSTSKLIRSSGLFDNDFLVTIGDTLLTRVTTVNPSFDINTPQTISVYNNRFLYKGILIRMEVPTTTSSTTTIQSNFTFVPTTNTHYSFACVLQGSNVVGITHTNSSFKSIHSGIIEVTQPTTNVTLDITVVGVNNDTISLYAYDRLYIDFVDPNAPIDIPTASPVVTPVVSVTVTPTVEPTTVLTNVTTTPTTAPSPITGTTDIVSPTSMKLRKNVNATTDSSVEYTFTGENIQVQLSYIVSSSLTDGEIRAYERITSTWYNDFYNTNFYTVHNTTTNSTDIIVIVTDETDNTTTVSSVEDDTNRKLQKSDQMQLSLSDNYGIVLGSMRTTINVTNMTYIPYEGDDMLDMESSDNITTKTTIQISYSQTITYRSSDTTSGNSKTKRNMQQQYLTIPYRSLIGRQLYIESLVASNIYTFSYLSYGDVSSTNTLSVPLLVGPLSQFPTTNTTTTTKTEEEKKKFAKGYIVVITIGGITVIAALIIVYQNNKYRLAPKGMDNEEVTTSNLLTEQRKQYADDMGSLRLHDSDISGVDRVESRNGIVLGSNATEYSIYAPAGRLGIVLDDPTVLGNTSNKDLKEFGPVISMIKEGSPLINDSNLNVGDMVVAIDGIDVRNMTPQKVSKLINDRSKHPIRKITCIRIPNMIQNINVPE